MALRPRTFAFVPRWAAALALVVGFNAAPAHGVTFIEQAQRLERIYAALLDLRPGTPPWVPADNERPFEAALELIPVPEIDNQVGSKKEPVNAPPAIPRARLRYDRVLGSYLGAEGIGAMAGATASLPVPVLGYTAVWIGGEGALTARWDPVLAALRFYALSGTVKGPITERGAADEFQFTTSGTDLRVGITPGPWRIYAGYGVGHLDTQLTVASDGARIREEGSYAYALAGAAYQWERWLFTFEQQATEDYLLHVILGASWRF